ncbi:hypothetical protein HaLaN_23114 [Haematococcus lacustris]|uniref:Uncharacterized protein n=1 Tax=Haematococcus lacustris TaxID=44745 RepID=A0A6A0A1Q9_HAELA|nr:hypothetical protein HaLaN_23114 [Haematococcus lacustris]
MGHMGMGVVRWDSRTPPQAGLRWRAGREGNVFACEQPGLLETVWASGSGSVEVAVRQRGNGSLATAVRQRGNGSVAMAAWQQQCGSMAAWQQQCGSMAVFVDVSHWRMPCDGADEFGTSRTTGATCSRAGQRGGPVSAVQWQLAGWLGGEGHRGARAVCNHAVSG